MSHFAELDKNNIVIRVLVGDDNLSNEGYDLIVENLGGTWVQTSYNSNFKNKFAGIGGIYLQEHDVFITPKPFDSWSLDSNQEWQAPTPYPQDEKNYSWNESNLSWVEIIEEEIIEEEITGE